MDRDAVIVKVFEHLEDDNLESAIMACLRLARGMKDYLNAVFMRELYPDRHEVIRALYDDMSDLKPEVQKFVYDRSLDRWLELHTLEFWDGSAGSSDNPGERRNVLSVSAGELEGELEQWERAIEDLALPQGMDPFDMAAFTDSSVKRKAEIRMRIKAIQTLKARMKARCLNYAVQMERQVQQQLRTQGFLENVQNDVNNCFKDCSEDVFSKLRKAGQLVGSNEPEDAALLLTEVRRALKAAADHFYPPQSGTVLCSDGKERVLGASSTLHATTVALKSEQNWVARNSSKRLRYWSWPRCVRATTKRCRIEGRSQCGVVCGGEARSGWPLLLSLQSSAAA